MTRKTIRRAAYYAELRLRRYDVPTSAARALWQTNAADERRAGDTFAARAALRFAAHFRPVPLPR